jgi:uncharacterized protein (TIGR02001 family)
VFATALFCCGSSEAQEQPPAEAEAAAAAEPADPAWEFDVTFGAALTSDYLFRGITQTDHEPALQPYIEPSYGIFYAGVWASNVDYDMPEPDVEVDLYLGMRPTLGPVEADFGFLHYLYPGASDGNYSEVKAAASMSPTDLVTLGGEIAYAWDYAQTGGDSTYLEGNAALSLPHDLSVSAALGYQMYGSDAGLSDYLTWNVGASYTWKAATFDLRYHDTDLGRSDCGAEYTSADACDARIVATVSIDTSWSALRGGE